MGTAVPTAEVLVVATAEDEQRLQRAIAEHDLIHGGLGLPPAQVVDLRQLRASTPALDPAAFSDREMYARWLQAQAAW